MWFITRLKFESIVQLGSWIGERQLGCVVMLAVRATHFSRNGFRDRPGVIEATPVDREDSPSLMGRSKDRVGK